MDERDAIVDSVEPNYLYRNVHPVVPMHAPLRFRWKRHDFRKDDCATSSIQRKIAAAIDYDDRNTDGCLHPVVRWFPSKSQEKPVF